jgi:hypothetical protein
MNYKKLCFLLTKRDLPNRMAKVYVDKLLKMERKGVEIGSLLNLDIPKGETIGESPTISRSEVCDLIQVRVRCSRALHRILLLPNNNIVLVDHMEKGQEDLADAFSVLSGFTGRREPCKCLKVKKQWHDQLRNGYLREESIIPAPFKARLDVITRVRRIRRQRSYSQGPKQATMKRQAEVLRNKLWSQLIFSGNRMYGTQHLCVSACLDKATYFQSEHWKERLWASNLRKDFEGGYEETSNNSTPGGFFQCLILTAIKVAEGLYAVSYLEPHKNEVKTGWARPGKAQVSHPAIEEYGDEYSQFNKAVRRLYPKGPRVVDGWHITPINGTTNV